METEGGGGRGHTEDTEEEHQQQQRRQERGGGGNRLWTETVSDTMGKVRETEDCRGTSSGGKKERKRREKKNTRDDGGDAQGDGSRAGRCNGDGDVEPVVRPSVLATWAAVSGTHSPRDRWNSPSFSLPPCMHARVFPSFPFRRMDWAPGASSGSFAATSFGRTRITAKVRTGFCMRERSTRALNSPAARNRHPWRMWTTSP